NQRGGAHHQAHVSTAARSWGGFLDQRGHDRPGRPLRDSHQRSEEQQLLETSGKAGNPRKQRKRKYCRYQNRAPPEAVGKSAKEESGQCQVIAKAEASKPTCSCVSRNSGAMYGAR